MNFNQYFIETQLAKKQTQTRFFPKLKEEERNLNVPSQLEFLCNLVVLLQYRETLVVQLSETYTLQNSFDECKVQFGRSNARALSSESANLLCDKLPIDEVNYMMEGNTTDKPLGVAVNEFDPCLRAHLNFQNA